MPPGFPSVDWTLAHFLLATDEAWMCYERFVLSSVGKKNPCKDVRERVLLGRDNFVGDHEIKLDPAQEH
jgi:hypothetical protein